MQERCGERSTGRISRQITLISSRQRQPREVDDLILSLIVYDFVLAPVSCFLELVMCSIPEST